MSLAEFYIYYQDMVAMMVSFYDGDEKTEPSAGETAETPPAVPTPAITSTPDTDSAGDSAPDLFHFRKHSSRRGALVEGMETCEHCKRAFLPSKLVMHAPSCSPDYVLPKVLSSAALLG